VLLAKRFLVSGEPASVAVGLLIISAGGLYAVKRRRG